MTNLIEMREKYGDEDPYSEVIYQNYRCRNCNNVATLTLWKFPSGEKYLLCDKCVEKFGLKEIFSSIKNSHGFTFDESIDKLEKIEHSIRTYDWSYEELLKRDLKLVEKWVSKVYGGG